MNRRRLFLLTIPAFLLFLMGCQTLDTLSQLGTTVGMATGAISEEQAGSINRSTSAVGKTMDRLTPENEYYIGRSVAASILKTYKPYDNAKLNEYLNTLGQSLAAVSDKPETFAGYHFLAIDTAEINAFAAPGGFILVSRGLLRCCKSEDALASVLAHEVGHIQHEHAILAIKKSRMTSALTILAMEGAKNLAGQDMAELTKAFEGSITDITTTLVNSGYARKLEFEADAAAITILERIGYNPTALRDMLAEMGKHTKPDGAGFGKTHPAPSARIDAIESRIKASGPVAPPSQRQARFQSVMSGV